MPDSNKAPRKQLISQQSIARAAVSGAAPESRPEAPEPSPLAINPVERLALRLAEVSEDATWKDRPSEGAIVWASLVKRNAPLMAYASANASAGEALALFKQVVARRDKMVSMVERRLGIEGQRYGSVTAGLAYACNELVVHPTSIPDDVAVESLVQLAKVTRAEPPQCLQGDVSGELTMTLNRIRALAPLVEEARYWSFGLPQEIVITQTHARIIQLIDKAESRFIAPGSETEQMDRELLYRSFYSQIAELAVSSYRRMATADRDRLLAMTKEHRREVFKRDYEGGKIGRAAMRNYLVEVGSHFGQLLKHAVSVRREEERVTRAMPNQTNAA